ncbi:hypothetical protein F8388_009765 [Cannabis sativa]|uniref:Uncharacterized protein n=1 Tax=Cannabis sativa TaxID=3483 RepID=A0A7J6H2Y9_CANSA|nr:hypothetical protein F8388_009765 [Cannabis sativa]
MEKPLTNNSNSIASTHETNVREINPMKALNPGLVFETTVEDYLQPNSRKKKIYDGHVGDK